MSKVRADIKLQVSFLKEGNRFIAYSPALDLSTSGKSHSEARSRFEEASSLFLEEIYKSGHLDEVLKNLGWQKKHSQEWNPPVVVSQETQTLQVPVA